MNDTASALLSVLRDGAPGVLGVLSLVLYLGSYLSLQLGLIRGDGWLFPTLNLAASLSLILSLTAQFNLYSMMVEVAWAVISVIGLIRLYIIYKYFHFTDEEQAAAKRLAPGLAKDRFRKLLSRGNWSDVSPGHVLTRESLPVTHLIYVASGVLPHPDRRHQRRHYRRGRAHRRDDLSYRPAGHGNSDRGRSLAHSLLRARRARRLP